MKKEDLEYQEQSPRDCFLCHFLPQEVAVFDPKLFTLVRQTKVDITDELAIEVSIIGESHIVRLLKNGIPIFAELLSCVDPRERGLRGNMVLSFSKNSEPFAVNGFVHTTAEIKKPILEKYRKQVEPSFQMKEQVSSLELEHPFPGPLSPRTMVRVWVNQEFIVWGSLHEYPIAPNFDLIEPLISTTIVNIKKLMKI